MADASSSNDLLSLAGAIAGAAGAVTGAIALGWEVFREYRERGRLLINVYVANLWESHAGAVSSPIKSEQTICGSVVNVGRRVIRIKGVDVVLKNGGLKMVSPATPETFEYSMPKFPYALHEEDEVQFRLPLELISEDAIGIRVIDTKRRE